MSKKRCCERESVQSCGCGKGGDLFGGLCANPACAVILLIILQKTCLLENNNAFLLILIYLAICCCKGGNVGSACKKSCGC